MGDARVPGPIGTSTNSFVLDEGTLNLQRSAVPGVVCSASDAWRTGRPPANWSTWDFIRWKALPERLGGDPDRLRRFKDGWVREHAKTIRELATQYRLPPVLLGGVAWIEVGGDPGWIDQAAFAVRRFDHSGDPWLEPLTVTKEPHLTSMGNVSIQVRRAAQILGMDPGKLTSEQLDEVATCLADDGSNLHMVAVHLRQLADIDAPRTDFLSDEQIRIVGARYNRGPDLSLERIRANTSYGDFILKQREHILGLLGVTP
jgi:hypothetical protein